jgi:hypothetical protein
MLAGKTFFVGLGAPKCGTSWLSDYLSKHPEVLMSPIWELRYFNQTIRNTKAQVAEAATPFLQQLERVTAMLPKNFRRGKKRNMRLDQIEGLVDRLRMFNSSEAYLEMFRKRIGPAHRVFGEHSPAYCTLGEDGFEAIRATHSPVRVIFIMRDPVDRHWSHVWFQLQPKRKKNQNQLAVEEKIRSDPEEIFERLSKTLSGSMLKRGRYDLTLQAMDKVFAPHEMLVLFYEELFTTSTIERIAAFLRISAKEARFEKRVNANGKKAELDASHAAVIRDAYAPVYQYCRDRFGRAVPASWRI